VLISLQKLASSSIAAARRALAGRISRLLDRQAHAAGVMKELEALREAEGLNSAAADRLAELEEKLVEDFDPGLALIPQEIPVLEELVKLADSVGAETKIERIIEVIEERFGGETVLFFTEYKATQALLMGALERKYGHGCVTFINGDSRVYGLRGVGPETRVETRQSASRRFRAGQVRFLVSTEAAAEGIDLQDNCATLIHVDLPWNPMRLHQRVGRLSRYGQTRPVDVLTFKNPSTIESHIWSLLDEKLLRITRAFQSAMDDPEDMRQLVIGMASPDLFEGLFTEAAKVPRERLEEWFNARTATLGGKDAVAAVRDIFGNVARFDFGQVSLLPRARGHPPRSPSAFARDVRMPEREREG
jgi:ERCC4-related helicase